MAGVRFSALIGLSVLLVLAFSPATLASPVAPSQCPDSSWTLSNGRCYRASPAQDRQTTLSSARNYCAALGSKLVSIMTSGEQTTVRNLCPNSGGANCWLGATRIPNYGANNFEWETQAVWGGGSYAANWLTSPGSCTRDWQNKCIDECVFMRRSDGRWATDECTQNLPHTVICVREALCPAGRYRSSLYNLETGAAGQCRRCVAGTYSDTVGVTTCTNCPAGVAGAIGATSDLCSGLCRQGFYCPEGTATGQEKRCPAGTFGGTLGLSEVSQCQLCAAGYYCPATSTGHIDAQGRTSFTSNNGNGNPLPCATGRCSDEGASTCMYCPAGYYCPGTGNACPGVECGEGAYCTSGRGSPIVITDAGIPINPAVPGSNTTFTGITNCPAGYYCQKGVARICPAGQYSTGGRSTTYMNCYLCADGYYCPEGSTSRTQKTCGWTTNTTLAPDIAKYYCPAGTPEPLIAPYGYYTTPTSRSPWLRYGIEYCPPESNNFCVNGTRYDIMSTNRCASFGMNEGWPCSLQDPRIGPSTCNNENSSYIWTNFNFTLHSLFQGWPTSIHWIGYQFHASSSPNCQPEGGGYEKNEDLFYLSDYPNYGSIGLKRRGFKFGLNHEVCPESRSTTSYRFSLLYRTVGIDPINGQFRNISYTCQPRLTVTNRNEPPYFTIRTKYLQVKEKALIGTPLQVCDQEGINAGCPPCSPDLPGSCDIEPTITAVDPDFFSSFTHFIKENDPETDREPPLDAQELEDPEAMPDNPLWKFDIEPCSGKLSVRNSEPLRYATAPVVENGARRYLYRVGATDQYGWPSPDYVDVYVYVINVNDAPILTPSDNFTFYIKENSPPNTVFDPAVPLYYDEDNDVLNFFDAQTYIPLEGYTNGKAYFSFNTDSQLRVTALGASILDFENLSGSFAVTVTGSDGNGGFDTKTYPVVVLDANDPPVFTVTGPFTINENRMGFVCPVTATTGVCGSGAAVVATDQDTVRWPGDIPIFNLTDDANGRFTINIYTGVISVTAPLDYETSPLLGIIGQNLRGYTLRVSAISQGHDLDSTVKVTTTPVQIIVINENEPPAFTRTPVVYTALETHPVGVLLTSIPTFLVDPDDMPGETSNPITYSISPSQFEGSSASKFSVTNGPGSNQMNLQLTSAADFETTPPCSWNSTRRCLEFTVQAFDGLSTICGAISVEILDVNEPPYFPGGNSLGTVTITENTDVSGASVLLSPVTLFFGQDPDIFRSRMYLRYDVVGGTGVSFFEVVNDNAPAVNSNQTHFYVRTKKNLVGVNFNYESGVTHYTLEVRMRDTGSSSYIGRGCLTIDDCGRDAACQTGRCFERCYASEVEVPRKSGPEMKYFCDYSSVTQTYFPFEAVVGTISIDVLDANDPPFLIGATETSPVCRWNSSIVFANVTTSVLTPVLGLLDVTRDEDPIDKTFEYVIDEGFMATGYAGVLWTAGFQLNSTTGQISLPANTNLQSYRLNDDLAGRIIIKDPRGANSSCIMVVALTDFNAPPQLLPNTTSIPENTGPGVFIFHVQAYDPDDILTYSIATNPNFVINPVTGIMTTSAQVNLNYEVQSEYAVLVRVRDSRNAEATATYTIKLIDVNDPPKFVNMPSLIAFPEQTAAGFVVASNLTAYVSDPDAGDVITFTFENCAGNAACPFTIAPDTGRITISSGLVGVTDFESSKNSWQVTIVITDSEGLTATAALTLALTDVNEPPTWARPVFTVNVTENTLSGSIFNGMAESSDPDAGDVRTFSIVSGNGLGYFSLSAQGTLAVVHALDYEDISSFSLTVAVRDKLNLNATAIVNIVVVNVNDLTISSVSPALLSTCTASEAVIITGSNFGLKLPQPSQTAVVTGKYRAAGRPAVYTATNCSVVVANTQIRCYTVPGVGGNLVWELSVSVPNDPNLQNEVVTGTTSTAMAYPIPVITGLSNGTRSLRTSGGESFRVFGTCLGSVTDQITFPTTIAADRDFVEMCSARSGCFTPTCSYVGQNLMCISPPGVGASLSMRVRIGGRLSESVPDIAAYGRPVVNSVSIPVLSTLGTMPYVQCCIVCPSSYTPCRDQCLAPGGVCGESQGCACRSTFDTQHIIVNGTNFGLLGSSPDIVFARLSYTDSSTDEAAFIDRQLTNCVVTKAFTEVSCTAIAPGVGTNMPLIVSFGDQESVPGSVVLSYQAPVATSMSGPYNRATTVGGQIIEIRGQNFGPVCGGSSSTSLLDRCPYVAATYTAYSRNPITGEIIIYEPSCRVVSQTLIFCLTTPGTGANLVWSITLGNQIISGLGAFPGGYSPPVVGAYSGPGADNALTVGGQEIFLSGSQFGPIGGASIIARYGLNPTPEFLASNCTVITANELIRCTTGPGAGTDLKWFVVVDGQSSVNAQTKYGAPQIHSVSGPGLNSSTEGGDVVFLDGVNFGPASAPGPFLDRVVYGPITFPYAYEASCSLSIPHTQIRCLTAPGVGVDMFWQVTIRSQTSVPSVKSTNYKRPVLLALSQYSANTKGGTQIRLSGLNMALCDAQSTPYVRFGMTNVEVSNRRMGVAPSIVPLICPTPDSPAYVNKEVTFVVPEMTSQRKLKIGYLLRSARLDYATFAAENELNFQYDNPIIIDVYAVPTVEVTRLRVTVTGRNFCASELCCQTLFDGNPVPIEDVELHTHDMIVFVIRSTGMVQVKCDDYSTPPRGFTAEDPYIIATTPKLSDVTFNTRGNATVIVWGLYFGINTPDVLVGGRPSTIIGHESLLCDDNLPPYADFASADAQIYCWKTTILIPAGEGKGEILTVKNGNQTSHFHSDDFERVRYEPPFVNPSVSFSGLSMGRRLATACCFNTDGSDMATMTLTGSNLGTQGVVWLGYVGNFKAIVVSWTHDQVVVRIPSGEGKDLRVLFFSGDQQPLSGPLDTYVSYAAPMITSTSVTSPMPTTGGSILTLHGANFGRPYVADCEDETCTAYPPQIRFVASTITFCDPISESMTATSVQCTVPPGAGANLLIRVTVAGQTGERLNGFSYDPPVILSITPQLVPTSGRDPSTNDRLVMTITGQNFGITDLCVKILDPRPGQPDFAIASRPVTQPVLFGCAQLDGTPPPVLLSSPSHSMIQLYVPEFHGKNVKIVVVSGGQASPVPGEFSYISPIVNTVQILNKTWPSGAGRVIGDFAFSAVNANNESVLSYGDWSNDGAARDWCHKTTFYGLRGYGWKVALDIEESGSYMRTITYYNSSSCSESRALFKVTVRGLFSDRGQHATLSCNRLYHDRIDSIVLEPLTIEGQAGLLETLPGCTCESSAIIVNSAQDVTQCFLSKIDSSEREHALAGGSGALIMPCMLITMNIKAGFGTYIIADNTKLFMSSHPLDASTDIVNNRATFSLPTYPTAEVVHQEAIDTPMGPTEGCYRFERQDTYLARLAIAERNGQTTTRLCEEPAYMILTGSNFGVSKPTLASGLRVILVNNVTGTEFEASTTSRGGDAGAICTTCSHEHNRLVVQIPPGAGKNLMIKVEIGLGSYAQPSQSPYPLFHYSPPFILESIPGSVARSKGFLNSEGESAVLRGYNFGGKPSNVTILLDGKRCNNAGWVTGELDIDGVPFLSCNADRDVVGPKSVMVCVAGQATMNIINAGDAERIQKGQSLGIWAAGISSSEAMSFATSITSTINTQCKTSSNGTKFYADIYSLCQPCPEGSNCNDLPETRFGAPPAADTFYRFTYPTWDPVEQAVPLRAQQRCPRETWDQMNLTMNHPSAVVKETCYDYVRCTPPESCTGANQCAVGYQYTLEECVAKRGPPIQPLGNSSVVSLSVYQSILNTTLCDVGLDSYTGEWIGNQTQCNPTGKTCKPGQPEYCSECTVLWRENESGGDAVPFGYCKCTEPERCAFCTIFKYYRLQGECKKCPDNPALLIAMFFVIAFLCILGGYILQRKNFNLAFISIGVDYFQVLALFASTNVTWPPLILELFNIFSLLNFNIDITAPECLVPTLEYDFKWYLMQSIPLMMAVLLFMIHIGYIVHKLRIKGHRADLYSHVSRLYAVYFTALYYLYITITKKALDIFNCNPADPDDGYFYTSFTSLSCEGSVCRCGEGLQAQLQPFAILALVLFTFGFPMFIASRLLRYRYEILEDQYLRANGIGESRLTNPNAYDVRKRYSKLYFHFKPELNFWILVIIGRKFGIVFAGLMFRGNTGFQLAVVLLVLFIAYVLQVTHRPYMSSGEREKVKEKLDVYVKKALSDTKYSWYPEIQQNVLEARRRFLKKKRKQLMVRFDPRGEKEDHIKKEVHDDPNDAFKDVELKRSATNYFFDYNTVEQTLLACAVLIALIGVMFESGRFTMDRPDLKGQYEFLTWAAIIVIFGSIIYYLVVFVGEMWQITGSNRCIRIFMRKKKEDKVTNEDIDDTVILDTNPIHAQLASSPLDIKAKQDEMADALKRAGEANEQLKRELITERKRAAEELARFEILVRKGLVQETEDDKLDDDPDGSQSLGGGSGSSPVRMTLAQNRRGRGKGTGMGDLLRGKLVSAGAALEQDRHMRAGRTTTVSKELGPNPILNEAYRDSVSYQQESEAINPIFQAERGGVQGQGSQVLNSMRRSFVQFGSAVGLRLGKDGKDGNKAGDDNNTGTTEQEDKEQ